MLHRTWIIGISIVALGLLSAACNSPSNGSSDRKVSANRTPRADSTESRPEWADDQPEYMTPVDDLTPEPTARVTDPLHYFTNRQSIMIRQPGNYNTNEIPRVAVWSTNDNGYNWRKQGHFGRGQTYFPLQVKTDGDYGVRFVGPGQDPANEVPASPARVYHVDTCPPEVEMWIEPEQTWYNVGDTITISWRANDPHLIEFPVRIGMMKDFTSDDGRLIEIQGELADEGALSYVLPPETFDHEVWFRVEAMDRANNLGVAYSFALQVVDTNLAATEELRTEVERIASDDGMTPEKARAILDRAAAEYGDLVSSMMTAIHEVSERGEEIRRSNAVGNAGPNEYGPTSPVFGREESSNDIAIGDIEPCDENARNATSIAMNTNGEKEQDEPKSVISGSLPYATAAAREVADSTMGDADNSYNSDSEETAPTLASTTENEVFEPQAEPFSYEQPAAAPTLAQRDVTPFDPTVGNGLLVPLPATVEKVSDVSTHAHPWRALGARRLTTLISDNIWTLPGRGGNFGWHVEFEGRFLADNPAMRNIAVPPSLTPTYADVAADMDGVPNPK